MINKIKIFALALTGLLFASCTKMDDSGDFGGYWQMLTMEQLSDGEIVLTKADGVFYGVHGNTMKLSRPNVPTFLATYELSGDSLRLTTIYKRPYDEVVPPTELAPVGVDSTGSFLVEHISSDRMVLKNTLYRLTFRKY